MRPKINLLSTIFFMLSLNSSIWLYLWTQIFFNSCGVNTIMYVCAFQKIDYYLRWLEGLKAWCPLGNGSWAHVWHKLYQTILLLLLLYFTFIFTFVGLSFWNFKFYKGFIFISFCHWYHLLLALEFNNVFFYLDRKWAWNCNRSLNEMFPLLFFSVLASHSFL